LNQYVPGGLGEQTRKSGKRKLPIFMPKRPVQYNDFDGLEYESGQVVPNSTNKTTATINTTKTTINHFANFFILFYCIIMQL